MELALFTGKPNFAVRQHVGGPIVEPETRERFHWLADAAFDRNFLTNDGPLARRLEEEVAARHGVAEAVFVANATLAQLILLKALGLDSGEVVVPANTFIATAHACEWQGMTPVFAELDPATLNLDPADFRRKITDRTRAVIPTHVFGVLADMPAITGIAAERGIAVLADAAHAFDCDRGGTPPGHFGVPEFLSFHATKFFSTFEGGAILSMDGGLARTLRELRNFGYTAPFTAGGLGLNLKSTEIAAAFGLASLPALEERRRRLAEVRDIYLDELAPAPGLRLHRLDAGGRNNYRYFALFVDEERCGIGRDALAEVLRLDNVLTRLYFHPGCHRAEYYSRRYPEMADSLPETDATLARILCLPTSFVGVDHRDGAKKVARILVEACGRSEAVAAALRRQA